MFLSINALLHVGPFWVPFPAKRRFPVVGDNSCIQDQDRPCGSKSVLRHPTSRIVGNIVCNILEKNMLYTFYIYIYNLWRLCMTFRHAIIEFWKFDGFRVAEKKFPEGQSLPRQQAIESSGNLAKSNIFDRKIIEEHGLFQIWRGNKGNFKEKTWEIILYIYIYYGYYYCYYYYYCIFIVDIGITIIVIIIYIYIIK